MGEIVSASLQGVLGVIKTEGLPANNKIGLDLQATVGETISEIECGSFFKATVTGSVIHQVSVNKTVLEENEKFIQKKAVRNRKIRRTSGGRARVDQRGRLAGASRARSAAPADKR